MSDKRCWICGKAGGRRVLFRYYRGGPWLCEDDRACYSRYRLAWARENFAERERDRFMEAVERRMAAIRAEKAARRSP